MTKVKRVIFMINGMVAAFDEDGQQIPECKGFVLEVGDILGKMCDKETKFSWAVPGIGEVRINVEWWFAHRRGVPSGTGDGN